MASTPTIIQLRNLMEDIVRSEVDKTAGRIGATSTLQQEALEKMALAIASKMLYHPLKYLKAEDHCLSLEERIHTVRTVFDLDEAADQAQPGGPSHA
jgi:glutamyl-tRNA reductase